VGDAFRAFISRNERESVDSALTMERHVIEVVLKCKFAGVIHATCTADTRRCRDDSTQRYVVTAGLLTHTHCCTVHNISS